MVFVGNPIPRKRAHLVIGAAARLEIEVRVVGDGPEGEALRALAADPGLGGRVRLLGQLPHEELLPVLMDADVLCAPSESEPFGNVHVEALASGVPVVGFGPSVREIGGRLGMAMGAAVEASGGVEEVAAALGAVLGGRWDRARLASAARQGCSPRGIAEECVRAYRAVTA